MNKMEIVKGIYRQNVYNINCGDGHYHHYTCYFDNSKNLLAVFEAGRNYNLTVFEENNELIPLNLSSETLKIIGGVLKSWVYDHIKPVELYIEEDEVFKITERDRFVIQNIINKH
jgi:hypothetical protein